MRSGRHPDPHLHHLLLRGAGRLDHQVCRELLRRERRDPGQLLRQHRGGHPLHRHLRGHRRHHHRLRRGGGHRTDVQGADAHPLPHRGGRRHLLSDPGRGRQRGSRFLPEAGLLRHHLQERAGGHEPGLLLPVPGHGHHDHLRLLHRQGHQHRELHGDDLPL